MSLFRKKKEETSSCCCGGNCDAESMTKAENAKTEGASVKVLGSGCAKCNQLEAATKAALEQLGMDTTIDHVTDFSQIAAYGVMSTPALDRRKGSFLRQGIKDRGSCEDSAKSQMNFSRTVLDE